MLEIMFDLLENVRPVSQAPSGLRLGDELFEIAGDFLENGWPTMDRSLAIDTSRFIPWGGVEVAAPTPVRAGIDQDPGGEVKGGAEVSGHAVGADDEVEIGDEGGGVVDRGKVGGEIDEAGGVSLIGMAALEGIKGEAGDGFKGGGEVEDGE